LAPARIRSFFFAPLSVGSDLVGAMSLSSPNLDAIPAEARDLVQRLGALTAPAIGYFLSKSQASGPG
jgi:hypothetical protein